MFWAGIYPDALRRLREQGRADHLIDYARQGKQSYHIVSTYRQGRYAEDADYSRRFPKISNCVSTAWALRGANGNVLPSSAIRLRDTIGGRINSLPRLRKVRLRGLNANFQERQSEQERVFSFPFSLFPFPFLTANSLWIRKRSESGFPAPALFWSGMNQPNPPAAAKTPLPQAKTDEMEELEEPPLGPADWPWVTLTMQIVIALVFFAMWKAGNGEVGMVSQAFGAKDKQLIDAGQNWRFVTPIFCTAACCISR